MTNGIGVLPSAVKVSMSQHYLLLQLLLVTHTHLSKATPSYLDTHIFTRAGNDATVTCRPPDGVETVGHASRSQVECCMSCSQKESCEKVAFSEQQGLCLLYDQPWTSDQCGMNGDWKAWRKGETNHTATLCLNGGEVTSDGNGCQCSGGYVGDRCERLMEDCYEGKLSGHYPNIGKGDQISMMTMPLLSPQSVEVRCRNNGYTLFQQRSSSTFSFARTWQEYVDGFQSEGQNFWLGLQNLYAITNSKQYNLGVFLKLLNGTQIYMTYENFRLTENTTYTASLGPLLEGDLGDILVDMNGQRFSTPDNDNDNDPNRNCAQEYGGGWWFNACAQVNFNGVLTNSGIWSGALNEVFVEELGDASPIHMSFRLVVPGT